MIAARNTKRSRKRPASRTPVRRGPSGATRHEGGSHYVSKSYSEGGSFTQGGQSVTAEFHSHEHDVTTGDESQSSPLPGFKSGSGESSSDDASDVSDDVADDGNYSSVSGTLTPDRHRHR